MSKPIIISIEGNIGAGKSTILAHLEKQMSQKQGIVFLKEPVDIWETIKDPISGENILQKFYGNSEKYAFPFQVMAYATRVSLFKKTIRENPDCKMIICERSLEADKHIFAQMLFDDGLIDNICFQIYNHFSVEFAESFGLDGVVYINVDADVCHQRIEKRAREGENGIDLGYLQNCKKYHDNWLFSDTKIDVLNICANSDVTYAPDDTISKNWLSQIESFIENKLSSNQESVFNAAPYTAYR